MWPTSVAMPVVTTRMVPAPRVTWQFMKAMSTRSPRAASAATASTCLGVGTLSPVSADSSISSVAAVRMRASAGTRSPASMLTMSPGTSSSIGTSTRSPFRRTLTLTTIIPCEGRCARLRLALLVHRHPRVEQGQQDQEDAGVELAGQEEADDARDEQHDLHRVRVLAAERLPARRLLRLGERVRAELRAPGVGFGGRQAAVDRDALGRERRVGRRARATRARPTRPGRIRPMGRSAWSCSCPSSSSSRHLFGDGPRAFSATSNAHALIHRGQDVGV